MKISALGAILNQIKQINDLIENWYKLRMNSLIGLRTSWSMKNEDTWKKSQRFGGISLIIGGVAMVVISFLTQGMVCMLCAMGLITCILAVDTCYTYKIAKKY